MSQPCGRCPCPGDCLGWAAFCGWAAEDPPDPIKIAHICARSRIGYGPAVIRVDGPVAATPIRVDYALAGTPHAPCCGGALRN